MKKAFTLIELLAVIIILSIIILITIPIVNNVINESKEDAYIEQKNRLIEFAQLYTLNNDVGYDDGVTKSIPFQKLIQEGLLLESPVDPRTGEYLSGCVTYTWSENMRDYTYELESDCSGIPEQVISVTFSGGTDEWTKTKQIGVVVNNYSGNFLYCTTIDETCNPTEIASNGSAIELKDYTSDAAKVCVTVEGAEVVCSNNFKLDNTGPSFSGVESIIVKTGSTVNLNENITVSDLQSGVNGSYTIDSSTLNVNIPGNYIITYNAIDNVGNTSSVNRTIIVGDAPVITFSPNGNTDWSNTKINVNVNITTDSNITYSNALWCSTKSSNCTPTTTLPSSGVATLTQNSASNRICVSVDSTVGSITSCSDTYKIDKKSPTLTPINSSVTVPTGSDIDLKTYFNTPTYGISGEKSFTCNYTNVNQLSSGTHTVTCTATGNNGLSTSASIIVNVQLNMLVSGTTFNSRIKALDGYDTAINLVFEQGGSSEYDTVASASKVDVSLANDNSIVAYVVGDTIKVQSASTMFFNYSAYSMFAELLNLQTINLGVSTNTSFTTNMDYMFTPSASSWSLSFDYYTGNLMTLNLGAGFDTSNVTTMVGMFRGLTKLTHLDLGEKFDTREVTNMYSMFAVLGATTLDIGTGFDTSNVTNMNYMFTRAKGLTSLDIANWDTSKVTNMSDMFSYTVSLTSIDVSNWDTSNVINMSNMFSNTSNLTSIDVSRWDTSSVTNMSRTFSCSNNYTSSLTNLDVSNWDTSSVTNMDGVFYNIYNLTSLDVSNWDTSNVIVLSSMFAYTASLTSLDVSNWDTTSVTDMSYMFAQTDSLTSVDVSNWDTSNVTDMYGIFDDAKSLTSLDVSSWDTSSVTDMAIMFRSTESLTSLDVSKWDTSNVTRMWYMFYNASNLTSLDVSNWDTSKVTNMSSMFGLTDSLTTLYVIDEAQKEQWKKYRSKNDLEYTVDIVVK